MTTQEHTDTSSVGTRRQVLPLYAAGFVTAFGAHSIAASLGGYTHPQHASLLSLGVLLAVYDGCRGRAQTGVRVAGRPHRRPPGQHNRASTCSRARSLIRKS